MSIETSIGVFHHPVHVLDYGASHQDWIAERYNFIGGSEAAIAIDCSPFSSKVSLILEKIGLIESFTGNEATYWGTKLEDLIMEECRFRFFNKPSNKVDFKTPMMKHPEHEWMSANLDGVGWSKELGFTILEAKNIGSRIGAAEWNSGNIPKHYFCQLQHYFCVMGPQFQNALICGLFSGNHFESRLVERDENFIETLVDAERELWSRIKEKRWKDLIDHTTSTSKALDQLYKDHQEKTITLDDEKSVEAANNYVEANQTIKEQEIIKTESKNHLKEMLKDHQEALIDGFVVRWKTTSRGERRFEIRKEE